MANFMDIFQDQLQNGLLDQLTGAMPGASKEQTQTATNLAVSTLLGAMTRNAKSENGLSSLVGALSNTHDGGILDNIGGLLSGALGNNKAADGMGILGHLLGDSNIFNIINMISKGSGMNRNNTMNLLMSLAPIVLGMVGKQKKQQQMQPKSVFDFLNQSEQKVRQEMPQQDLITKLLDRDGDGSAVDEIAGMGMKVLGNLFKR